MAKAEPDSAAAVLRDVRRLLIAVVIFGLAAWGFSAFRDYQNASMGAARAIKVGPDGAPAGRR